MRMLCLSMAVTTLALLTFAASSLANERGDLEKAVCGSIQEPLAFTLWSSAAGRPDPKAASRVPNVERVIHKSKDGRALKGYKLRGTSRDGGPKGFLLVAQGNATLADQLLGSLSLFSGAGLDVYVFDYRGYGDSEGKRRLKAIVSDYRELFESISASTSGERLLYGMSFGGVVLLDVIGSGVTFDRAVIDSTPSRISNMGCPQEYDPVANFPQDGSLFLLIAGGRDKVVPLKNSQELLDLAKARGARTEVRPDFAHSFMDSDIDIHRARLELIKSFLTGSGRSEEQ